MKILLIFIILQILILPVSSQSKTENLIIITLDGMRWQEVFGGADDSLINNAVFTSDSADIKNKYWAPTKSERRKKLMPFLWSTVVTEGQIHGNREYGSKVNVLNRYRFSYPGYNEIFTGYPDTLVNSNNKTPNKNTNVLEFINSQRAYKGKVAAFTSWDVFDAIFNEQRSGFLVNCGIDTMIEKTYPFPLLNEMQQHAFRPFGDEVRLDMFTYYLAREYLRLKKPKVLYLAFDETDDHAHNGKYDYYLNAAHITDQWIKELWTLLQSMPEYKSKTTLIITTDHGRGDRIKKDWTSHGADILGADEIWIAVMGPGVVAKGEVKTDEQIHQAQLAQTISKLLGFGFKAEHPVEKEIEHIIR